MNDIIVRTDMQFQTKELNDAVKGLSKAFQNIDKNRRDACLILWRLEDGKKYEKDGFKSLADFAETIGIDKSSAHRMADAGRVYDSKVPEIAEYANKAGYTAASAVASMLKDKEQSKVLEEAIKDKTIDENMTVNDVKAWKANKIATTKKETVLPRYNILGYYVSSKGEYEKIDLSDTTIEDLTESYISGRTCDIKNLNVKNSDGKIVKKVTVALMEDGAMLSFSTEKVKENKAGKPKAKKSLDDMTPEEAAEWFASKGLKVTFTNVSEG